MNLSDIKSVDRDFLIPKEVAQVIGCDPYKINCAAHDNPEKLGFPVIIIGNRVKIPRVAFIKFMEGELNNGND